MESKNQQFAISETLVTNKIYIVRSKKIMLDRDLAELYEVETRALNQAVYRNMERFPEEFMFQLTADEFEILKSQIVMSASPNLGRLKLEDSGQPGSLFVGYLNETLIIIEENK